MTAKWDITRTPELVRLTRKGATRWDVQARTTLPDVARGRLAHLVRQDVWRALQNLRGFRPMVEVSTLPNGVDVRAGGQVDGSLPPCAVGRVQRVLDDAANRNRWVYGARHS